MPLKHNQDPTHAQILSEVPNELIRSRHEQAPRANATPPAKIRNLLFSMLFACFALGPTLLVAGQAILKLDLPAWLTSESSIDLTGGSAESKIRPNLSIEGFLSGNLQTAIEEKVGAFIPMKESALYGNACLQRAFIRASNEAFEWKCYPTFFGSTCVFSPDTGVIARIAPKESSEVRQGISTFISQVKEYATKHPNTEFVVYFAPSAIDTSELNPTNNYVSNVWDYEKLKKLVRSEEPPPNLSLLLWDSNSSNPGGDSFFKYDHHWTIKGALIAYEQICGALQIKPLYFGRISRINNAIFSGTQSRDSLCLLREDVFDLDYDFSNLELVGNDYNASKHDVFWSASETRRMYDFHELYYGDLRNAQIEGGAGNQRLLLIGDSYANCLTRLLAESSASLMRDTCLYARGESVLDLSQLIRDQDADAVVFVARSGDFATFLNYNPEFFK